MGGIGGCDDDGFDRRVMNQAQWIVKHRRRAALGRGQAGAFEVHVVDCGHTRPADVFVQVHGMACAHAAGADDADGQLVRGSHCPVRPRCGGDRIGRLSDLPMRMVESSFSEPGIGNPLAETEKCPQALGNGLGIGPGLRGLLCLSR